MEDESTPPPEVQTFIDEVAAVCAKHGMTIAGTDDYGLFISYDNGLRDYGHGRNGVWIWDIGPDGIKGGQK